MTTLLLVIHLLIATAMVGLILLQRSEGGGLGIGGAADAFGASRGVGNILTRMTAWLGAMFMASSLFLVMSTDTSHRERSLIDEPAPAGDAPLPEIPALLDLPPLPGGAPAVTREPSDPAVPLE